MPRSLKLRTKAIPSAKASFNGMVKKTYANVTPIDFQKMSTHDFATLGQFADKVILLKGTVLRVGPPDEVLASPEFQEVFHLNLGKGNLGKGGRG